MKNSFLFPMLILFGLLVTNNAHAYVTLNGDLSGQTLTAGTYFVNQCSVADGAQLTIEAGAVLKFNDWAQSWLSIAGQLYVNGTSANNVYFTSKNDNSIGETITNSNGNPQPGDWGQISIYSGLGRFDYCVIKYGGDFANHSNLIYQNSSTGWFRNSVSEHSSNHGIATVGSNVEMTNSTFQYNWTGIYSLESSELQIDNCNFNNNGSYAMTISGIVQLSQYTNLTLSQNGINAISVSGNISSNVTWPSNSDYSIVIQALTIDAGVVCTIPAGTVIKNEYSISLLGTLDVNGTESEPVIFTSLQDDTYGGDTNNDGTTTSPSPGDWQGISVSGLAEFDYCRVRYGGYYNGSQNIYFSAAASGHFNNSICEYSLNKGLNIGSDLEILNSRFDNNGTDGIYASAGELQIYDCQFNNNGINGISAIGGELQIDDCQFNNNGNYATYLRNVDIKSYSDNSGSGNFINAFGICGIISENIIFEESITGFPFVVIGNIVVNDGFTLTIPAGEVIKFTANDQLSVYGTLDVNGTEANPVIFTSLQDDTYGGDLNNDGAATSPAPGDWNGIFMLGYSSNDGIGEFEYCRVRYGGNNIYYNQPDSSFFNNSISEYSLYRGLYFVSGAIEISNSSFNNNGTDGIYASGQGLHIDNCQFNNNGNYAAYLDYVYMKNYSNNSGSGNFINAFGIRGIINENMIFDENITGFPFIIIGDITVNDGFTLTIPAGEVIKFTENGQLIVAGTLDANGTESDPVIFTSFLDDTYGGDINNDGNATVPAPGDWKGIKMSGSSGNDGIGEFDYCRIRYGGSYNGNNIHYYYSEPGYFNNSIIEYSSGRGLYVYQASVNVNNSSFINNTTDGFNGNGGPFQVDNCNFNDNGNYGVYLSGTIQLENCEINNNGNYAAYLDYIYFSEISSNSGSGNGIDAFGISGATTDDFILSESEIGFPVVISGKLTVSSQDTLSVPAGEIIKFTGDGYFKVDGAVDVNGTSEDEVVFTSFQDDTYGGDTNNDGASTSPAPGDWGGIFIYDHQGMGGLGEFDYCRIRYGGANISGSAYGNITFDDCLDYGYFNNSISEYSSRNGLKIDQCSVVMDGSSFNNNIENGIYAYGNLTIDNCQFNDNGNYAAYLVYVDIKSFTNNSGSGNFINAFGIRGVINQNMTLSESITGFPFVIIGNTEVNNDVTLTIPAGEIIKFTEDGKFSIRGTFTAIGTDAEPIIFTSFSDDSFGGDLNNDGAATIPAPGDWNGIFMDGYFNGYNYVGGIGEFNYCRIRYGGSNSNVSYDDSESGYFNNCISEFGLGYGIKINDSSPAITGSTFENNDSYGIYITGSKVPDLGQNDLATAGLNTFIDNDGGNYQLYNTTTLNIDAYYNDWGYYTEAGIDAHIYDDNENAAYGEVLFNPWYDPSNPRFEVDIVVFLEGSFNGTLLDADLNTILPLTQPYDIAPWNYAGTESVATIPNTNVVDWVLIELCDTTDAALATGETMIAQQAAFLLNDGSVVGLDGSSILSFNHSINHSLFVVVWHRNHISVLSAYPATSNGLVYNYDFSTAASQAYGTDAQKHLGSNIYGMIGGDANADGTVDLSDKIIWSGQAGTTGYKSGDFDLDGQVNNMDKNEIWAGNNE